jgi:hypothetical protein
MPKTASAINYDNARDADTQTAYAPFFDVIRNHKAYNLYFQFSVCLTQPPGEGNKAKLILNQYEKEKKKLMKELQIYKTHCKQPGVIIDRIMWGDHMTTPRIPYTPTIIHNYEDCPNPEECNQCIRPI